MPREILSAENFNSKIVAEITDLNADVVEGGTVIEASNPSGFVADDYVFIGVFGSDIGEIRQIDSISADNITLTSALENPHKKYEKIVKLLFNQVRFYRASNVNGTVPDDVDFTAQATVDIQADKSNTDYIDTAGGSDYWYKVTYFNSQTSVESSLANAIGVRGGSVDRYTDVTLVRKEAGLESNQYISDVDIEEQIERAESEVKASLLIGGYTLPFTNGVPSNVKKITELLAAGYLLLLDYGVQYSGTNKEGEAKVKDARKQLQAIENGKAVLLDPVTDEAVAQSSNYDGFPLDGSVDDNDLEYDRMFSVNQSF